MLTCINDVGKTSCVEAFLLLIGGFNPALPLQVNVLRGLEGISPNSQEQWGWLFYNRDTAHAIEIFATLAERGEDILRIHLGSHKEFELLSKGEQELRANVSGTRAGLEAD